MPTTTDAARPPSDPLLSRASPKHTPPPTKSPPPQDQPEQVHAIPQHRCDRAAIAAQNSQPRRAQSPTRPQDQPSGPLAPESYGRVATRAPREPHEFPVPSHA